MALVFIVDESGWRVGHTTQAVVPNDNQKVDLQFYMHEPLQARDLTDLVVLLALNQSYKEICEKIKLDDMHRLQRFLDSNQNETTDE